MPGLLLWAGQTHLRPTLRTKLKEIVDIQFGLQLRSALETGAEGTHLVIQTKDIDTDNDFNLRVDQLSHFTPDRQVDKYMVRNEDVLLLGRGNRPYATVVNGLTPGDLPTVALYYFFILRPKSRSITSDFLAWAINETEAQGYFATASRGTAIPFLSKGAVEDLEIRVPDLAIQAKIIKAHRLAVQEKQLSQALQRKRAELVRAACLNIYQRGGLQT